MKKINSTLIAVGLILNVLSVQAMLTKRAATYKKLLAEGKKVNTQSGPLVNTSSPFGQKGQQRSYSSDMRSLAGGGWKKSAHPFTRSFMSYIPFTQDYSNYQKKYSALGQFRYLLDKWDRLICHIYPSKNDRKAALVTLRDEMRGFNLNNIAGYEKEVYVYTASLLNSCFEWLENNNRVDINELLEALLTYFNTMEVRYKNILDKNLIEKEYPFFRTLNMRLKQFGEKGANIKELLKDFLDEKTGDYKNASYDQVKEARRDFMQKNHEDKNKHLSEEDQQKLKDLVMKVNSAMDEYEAEIKNKPEMEDDTITPEQELYEAEERADRFRE